ncbi:MAG: YbhN family protein [Bifidobacterium sp.]|jgi:uncharacterized protein (TIRG00374 family)|nr:YbhN family protein [Bifidobacterium sp.]MCI1865484.1 YbhN family protein [Bifidobacterium sp.]
MGERHTPAPASPQTFEASSPRPTAHIDDTAPRRTRNLGDLTHAVAALVLAAVVIVLATYMRGITSGVESDARSAGKVLNWLMDVPASLLQQLATVVIVVGVLIHLLVNREWMQSAFSVIAMFCGYGAVRGVSLLLSHISNPVLLASMQSVGGNVGGGLLPDIYAGVGAFLTVAGPRRIRSSVRWGWNILYSVGIILVVVSWDSVVGLITSYAIGRLVGMLLRFIIGMQSKGLWGSQIIQTLRGIDCDCVSLIRRKGTNEESGILRATLDDDLIENSRIYDAVDARGRRYIVSVLDSQVHIAGYLNQLWQWIRLSGVPMRHDRSANDANHHHLSMILGLRNIGLDTPDVYGVVDGGESSILVFGADRAPLPCNLHTLSDDDSRRLMAYLSAANMRGYTHRRITPDTLARFENGTPLIAGWQNGDCASGGANATLDKVQLLTLLCALNGIDRSVATARSVWGDDVLLALTPFIQKAAVPAATRALAQWNRHMLKELRTAIQGIAPDDAPEPAETVTLSRFSIRSFIAITLSVIAVAVIFTQLRPNEVIAALTHAKPTMAVLCIVFSLIAWMGSAVSLGAFMERDKRDNVALFCSQAAQGFTAVSMPAGVGPAFVNLQFLRKNGYRNTAATAITSATWIIQALTTVMLLLIIGIFTGRSTLSGMIPTNTLITVIGIVTLLACAAMAIPAVRRMLTEKYLPIVATYARQLLDVLTQPKELTFAVLGSLVLNVATGLGFWASLLAFGCHTNPMETIFIFLLANTLGSAVPTPGGLGAVEAALTFAFTSVGVPAAVALSATLLYRVGFYWLRIPMGALAMKWLDAHNLI